MKNPSKPRHTKAWFTNRVGKQIIKNSASDLFNPPITIMSEGHAKALFLTQTEKNYSYEEII